MRYRIPKELDDIGTKIQEILDNNGGYPLVEVYHPAQAMHGAEKAHWSLYHKDGNYASCYALVGEEPKSFAIDLELMVIRGAQG